MSNDKDTAFIVEDLTSIYWDYGLRRPSLLQKLKEWMRSSGIEPVMTLNACRGIYFALFNTHDGPLVSKYLKTVINADVAPATRKTRTCPKCRGTKLPDIPKRAFSATVRCPDCDCSIGLNRSGGATIVYDPEDK